MIAEVKPLIGANLESAGFLKSVLMLTKHFHPHVGGVETHVQKVSKELAARGYRVAVCCANTEKTLVYEQQDGYEIFRGDSLECFQKEFFDEFDIVHCHDFEQYRDVYERLNIPVYITFHGYEGHVPPNPWTIKRRQDICGKVSGTIHIGSYLKKWYGTDHKNDIVLLGGVDKPEAFIRKDPAKPFKVAYLGRMAADKKTDLYQEAAGVLQNEGVISFQIYSDLQNEMVRPMWMGQDVGYLNGQLSMLEAMACGIPVVALESNEMVKDMLQDFPCLRAGTVAGVIDHTVRLINDQKLYQDLSCQGWDFALKHTWKEAADAYERLWAQSI